MKARMSRKQWRVVFTGVLVGAVAWGVQALNKPDPVRQVAVARRWAGLAPLPSSATGVRVFETGALTWTGFYLRFAAPPQQIDAFLDASPGLQGKPVELFSPAHQFLPAPPTGPDWGNPKTAAHAYFFESPVVARSAPWFDRTVRQAGRRYKLDWRGNYGEVVVDDARHTVYVYVADS